MTTKVVILNEGPGLVDVNVGGTASYRLAPNQAQWAYVYPSQNVVVSEVAVELKP